MRRRGNDWNATTALTRCLCRVYLFRKLLPLFRKFKPSGFILRPVGLHGTLAAIAGIAAVQFGRHFMFP
jgi:hypothetical protein